MDEEVRDPAPEWCEHCNGEGTLEVSAPLRDDPHYAKVVACEVCNGNGWI